MTSRKPGGIFDPDGIREEIAALERQSAEPSFWDNRSGAESTMGRLKELHATLDPWQKLMQQADDLVGLYELAEAEGSEELAAELEQGIAALQRRFDQLSVMAIFTDPRDKGNAFVTIHSGAGGMEANDWVQMLLGMYTRWIERREFKSEVLDLQDSEGGIKSVTVQVNGDHAFGYLKAETGIHRLVRISPFDSGGRRHTSFASVYVSPVIEDDIDVEVKPEDIRVDTYRASGAGGQHVNKTDSAVRITHFATGIVVQCQNERSQHKNRATAMKVLKSRLYDYYKREQEEEQAKSAEEKRDISWGNQIRSYVFQPYTMVKDLRTRVETGNIQAVMEGDLDQFIEAFLKQSWQGAPAGGQ